ncbi:MAG: LptF/LptG family permease [Bacteroidales bacterium]|nr:LptF/LptG family permease [Bacteroidales bacterium]MBR5780537.1 LptF/LptG family permease [Bacteroidales bacterium]
MKKLDWYIFKKYIGTFIFSISLLIIIVIVFDVSENIDSFIKNNASFKEVVLHYYVPFIPYFINLFIYLFVFISVIFFTSKMAGHTEIIAILSSGISFRRFLYPYILAATMLAAISFYLGNFLIPQTDTVRRVFKDTYMEKLTKSSGSNIHVQIEKGVYVYVGNFDIKKKIAYKFSLEKIEDNKLTYKVIADKATFDTINGKWQLSNYVERFISPEESLNRGKTKDTTLVLKPRDLYNIKEEFEEMNLFEIREHIQNLEMKGADHSLQYRIEMHKRIASPAAILILTVIGAALSSRKVRGGMGLHLGLGIVITFSYILFMEFSRVFAISGVFSPFIAAWLPNIVFSIIGIYFFVKAPK